jgi:esterase
MIDLFCREYGAGEPLVVLHGLLGQGANWATLAKRLGGAARVLVPDLRNHGRSPHAPTMTYPELAADVVALLDARGLADATLLGHSLGGKVAMHLAFTAPERVRRLIVVDIAPVAYPPRHAELLATLMALDLTALATREAVDAALAPAFPDPAFRQFLLMNLKRDGQRLAWAANLPAIAAALPALMGFAPPPSARPYPAPALLIVGDRSRFVEPAHAPAIARWLPQATQRTIPGAGHWVHADQPEAFLTTVAAWLGVAV